ncbi:MAG TPA: hypothetical protein VKN36_06065 [Eudoraea sp.]|nr:hypothetical protein [Eudoraea sp.]
MNIKHVSGFFASPCSALNDKRRTLVLPTEEESVVKVQACTVGCLGLKHAIDQGHRFPIIGNIRWDSPLGSE